MENDVIILAGRKQKWILIGLLSAAFVAGGVEMIRDGDTTGWGVALFFGLCLLVSVYMLTPNAIRLKIDQDGLEMKTLAKPMKIAWQDVDSFYVATISTGHAKTKMIGIKFSDSYMQAKAMRKVASAITGIEGAIPDNFSLPADKLCELLNSEKQRRSQA